MCLLHRDFAFFICLTMMRPLRKTFVRKAGSSLYYCLLDQLSLDTCPIIIGYFAIYPRICFILCSGLL